MLLEPTGCDFDAKVRKEHFYTARKVSRKR